MGVLISRVDIGYKQKSQISENIGLKADETDVGLGVLGFSIVFWSFRHEKRF